MDKVTSEEVADVLYTIKELMKDHHITLNQAFYLMCELNNIEYTVTVADISTLFNKGLLVKGGKVNVKLLFHLRTQPKQLTMDLPHESKPIGTDISLAIAEKIEKEFVPDVYLTDEEKKYVADKYFKGDLSVARYFIIFRSLFPVKRKTKNEKWNKKFSFVYDGVTLWDDSMRVAKKFHEIYRKKDIGAFLEATYMTVKDSTNIEEERCYMTKPYKFLTSYDTYYREALERMEDRAKKKSGDDKTKKSAENLKL